MMWFNSCRAMHFGPNSADGGYILVFAKTAEKSVGLGLIGEFSDYPFEQFVAGVEVADLGVGVDETL